jgi:prophage regulatory protein
MNRKVIRKKEVMRRTGLSSTTLWRLERNGEFVPRIRLSKQAVGWYEDEVNDWLEKREPVDRRDSSENEVA